jgi:hypothetical protein
MRLFPSNVKGKIFGSRLPGRILTLPLGRDGALYAVPGRVQRAISLSSKGSSKGGEGDRVSDSKFLNLMTAQCAIHTFPERWW